MRMIVLSVGAFAVLVAGCESPYESYPEVRAMAEEPRLAVAFLSDTTFHTWGRDHGTQYEYLAPDHSTRLVYPGNMRPVVGEWQVRGQGEFKAEMCFRYGANTIDPVTGQHGGDWECGPLIRFLYEPVEIYDGDVFGLMRMKVFPRPLPEAVNISIPTALKAIGLPPPETADKAPSKRHR